MSSLAKNVGKTKSTDRKRLPGTGRKVLSDALHKLLRDWYENKLEARNTISCRRLLLQGLQIKQRLVSDHPEVAQLKLSKGWLDKFLARNNIVLHRTTTVCRRLPSDYIDKICNFVLFVQRKIADKLGLAALYGADETAVWLDPPAGTSLAPRGARDVAVRSTSQDKLRITIMLTARANRQKGLSFVLLKCKRAVKSTVEKFQGKLQLAWAGKTWIDDSLTKEYLESITGLQLFHKRLLVWDSF